jgi:hypothetical protein
MKNFSNRLRWTLAALSFAAGAARGETLPDSIQAHELKPFLTLQAEGAQIYQCKAGADGKLLWTFREPIAALMRDGVTVGRHFAGPSWQLNDGGRIQGKITGRAPGATAADAPWLKLEISARDGGGLLSDAAAIQRVRTLGGALEGPCEAEGALRSVPYSADYVFLKP